MPQVIDGAVLDNLDGVDAAYHGMFTERDGKFEFDGVAGLKTQADITRLQGGLEKERTDHKVTKASLLKFDGIDPETVHGSLDRITELEAAAGDKLDDEAINKIVDSRLVTKTAPLERTIATLTTERDTLASDNETHVANGVKRTIKDAVIGAVNESKGFNTEAIEDAVMYGERIFEVSDDKTITARDGVGVTPGISPADWLLEMQTKKSYWWGTTTGGDARPGGGLPNGEGNPWSNEHWNVTKQNALTMTNRTQADQLAKAAGGAIGMVKPPVKK